MLRFQKWQNICTSVCLPLQNDKGYGVVKNNKQEFDSQVTELDTLETNFVEHNADRAAEFKKPSYKDVL